MSTLHLVRAPMPTPSPEPRVFTASFVQSLAQLNRAERELRAMGLHVERVMWQEPNPVIRIARDGGISLEPLLDRMGPRRFRQHTDGTEIWGDFKGITVCWRESLPALSPQSTLEH